MNGAIADRMDLRHFLLVESIIGAFMFTFIAFTTDSWFLTLLNGNVNLLHNVYYSFYLLNGIVYSGIYPAGNGIILNWIDEKYRGRVLTIWIGSLNVGGIIFF